MNRHFALGVDESVVAGTEGSSRICFMEDVTGRLEKGIKTDLAVVYMVWESRRC